MYFSLSAPFPQLRKCISEKQTSPISCIAFLQIVLNFSYHKITQNKVYHYREANDPCFWPLRHKCGIIVRAILLPWNRTIAEQKWAAQSSVSYWTNVVLQLLLPASLQRTLSWQYWAHCCSLEWLPAVGSLTCHIFSRPVSGGWDAQRRALKLMKHQHGPPPGHYAQPMSWVHIGLKKKITVNVLFTIKFTSNHVIQTANTTTTSPTFINSLKTNL